jgi:hypothetical protein
MLPPLDQFNANIVQVKQLVSMAAILDAQTTAAIDVGDIYRAAFVLGVSALDHYVHEKTLAGMIEASQGQRPHTPHFGKFRVSLDALGPGLNNSPAVWLEQEVRRIHSLLTFQRADAIADALRLVHPDPLWPALALTLSRATKDAKDTLDLIVERRNKIAHEADCEPNGLGIKWPISKAMLDDTIAFLEAIANGIDVLV